MRRKVEGAEGDRPLPWLARQGFGGVKR